jgi:putative lipoic acid-binding regulatory protein
MTIPYKLRVTYIGRLNKDMDDSIIALVEEHGYELSTTGYHMKTHERQLNFEGGG